MRHFETVTRVGFIPSVVPLTRNIVSGMPWNARQAIRHRSAEISTLLPQTEAATKIGAALTSVAPGWTRYRDYLRGRFALVNGAAEHWVPELTYGRIIHRARCESACVLRRARKARSEVLFGVCSSAQLYELNADVPIVYFSDATARMTLESYPHRQHRGHGYNDAWNEIERVALQRAAAAIFPSREALQSAIDDYGLPPERGFVIATGANVVPEYGFAVEAKAPEDRKLELCIVASEPGRKRVDFAIETVSELVKTGYDARLHFIGARYEPALASPLVEWAGRLRLSDREDRARHAAILAKSHLMLLPSIGEAFSIATMEAAHFGRPSVVTHAGGMPTQVRHDETGLVLPLEATPADWARAIDRLVGDPERYLAMCRAARARAREEFTWLAWGNGVVRVIEEVVAKARSGARAV